MSCIRYSCQTFYGGSDRLVNFVIHSPRRAQLAFETFVYTGLSFYFIPITVTLQALFQSKQKLFFRMAMRSVKCVVVGDGAVGTKN